jgi:tetratricopeptide (TPR) repeat protein
MKKTSMFSILVIIAIMAFSGCSPKYSVETDLTPDQVKQYEDKIQEDTQNLDNAEAELTVEEKVKLLESIGVNHERLGAYDKAITLYEEILQLDPENYLALNNIMKIYDEVGEKGLASDYAKTLYQYYGQFQNATADVIRILVKNGEFENAKLSLEEYARNYQSPETQQFISEQFEYIQRMSQAAESANINPTE